MTVKEALQDVHHGATVALGGFGLCGFPFALVDELHRRRVTDLTLIGGTMAGPGACGTGPLARDGQIKRAITTYVGENKPFVDALLAGKLEVVLCPMGSLITRLYAAGSGVPAFYTPTGYGTAVQTGHLPVRFGPDGSIEKHSEPRETRQFHGRWCVLETALYADVGLIRAWKADTRGNLVFRGTTSNFNCATARASAVCIAEVEEIVEAGTLPPSQIHLPGIYVDRLVKPDPVMRAAEFVVTRASREGGDEASRQRSAALARSSKHRIARRAALEIADGMHLNLGVGVPNIVASYIPESMDVVLQGENGVLGLGPYPTEEEVDVDFTNAGKQTVTLRKDGSSLFDSQESFTMIRGGHMDLTMLGALQVSANGDIASWYIPGKVLKGMGGAMDLVASNCKTVVLMEHCAKDGQSRVVDRCSIPLTGVGCVNMLITDLATFRFATQSTGVNKMVLCEVAEGVTVEEVRAKTEATFEVSPDLRPMKLAPVIL